MNTVKTPQSRCKGAVARYDITPPVGIYHRMWGAALHDRAAGVHRPLEATLLWLEPIGADALQARIILSLDHCILDGQEMHNIREAIHRTTAIPYGQILISLTHTHGSGWMSRTRSHLPGGDLIGPYLDELATRLAQLAGEAQARIEPVQIVYGQGRSNLAAHRDFLDAERGRFVCGYHPDGPADDTLLLASVFNERNERLATVVNYACHPTTLAWDNQLISPDWVGAMRETIEQTAGGLCLFLQGASGDLGPREGFVGDPAVADRNGRKVAYAALAEIVATPEPSTEFRYAGAVTSGTEIGTWRHEPEAVEARKRQTLWHWEQFDVELPYRHDLPTIEQTTTEKEHWLAEEAKARELCDEIRIRDCRAQVEQRTRQLTRLLALVAGKSYPLTVHLGLVGEAIWLFVPGELYQVFQTQLRARFAPHPVFVATLTNDWQPGYIPPASTFGYGIYQEVIAATSPGSMEILIEAIARRYDQIRKQVGALSA